MTWSLTSTITEASKKECIRTFFDDHLSTFPSWTVATPASDSNSRNAQYDIGTKNVYDRTTIEISFRDTFNTINGPINTAGASTWQDAIGNEDGFNLSSSLSASEYKLWTSSVLTDSFLLLDGSGNLLWGWIEAQTYFILGADGWNSTARAMEHTTPLGITGLDATNGKASCTGMPGDTAKFDSSPHEMGWDLGYNTALVNTYTGANGKVIKGFMANQITGPSYLSSRAGAIMHHNSDDFLLHTGITKGNPIAAQMQTMTDGTNWYLRTNGDVSTMGLLFPVGTSEPTF